MTFDYDEFYKSGPNALGEPTKFVVEFFADWPKAQASILDVGCGQGRDALMIARLGHKVHGIDVSPTGIEQMLQAAKREGLNVTGEVVNIETWDHSGFYDLILFDRVLHMVDADLRPKAVANFCAKLGPGGTIVLLDETKNMNGIIEAAGSVLGDLVVTFQRKGHAILERQ